MLVSGTALVLAGTAFAVYDVLTFRDYVVHQILAQAELTAANSEAALERGDQESAGDTLSGLGRSLDIRAARIMTNSGEVLASFKRTPDLADAPPIAIPAGRREHSVVTLQSV